MTKEKGSILVFTVITVGVLMVVGLTFASVTTAEYRTAVNHSSGVQAFYVAEAGLNWAMHGLHNKSITLPTGYSVGQEYVVYRSPAFPGSGPTSSFLSEVGDIRVVFTKTADGWEIVSQGLQGQAKKSVSIKVVMGSEEDTALSSVSAVGPVKLEGSAQIIGSLAATSLDLAWSTKITGDVDIVGTTLEGKIKLASGRQLKDNVTGTVRLIPEAVAFTPPNLTGMLPTGLTSRGSFTAGWWPEPPYTLPGSGRYDTISVQSELRINVPNDFDVVIRVRTLSVTGSGRVVITGTGKGRVIFHVEESLVVSNSATINNGGNYDKVDVYYYGTQTISLGGSTRLVGSVIAQSANVNIGNSGGITGHIITGGSAVDVTGSAAAHLRVLYAPAAKVYLGGSGQLRGIVVGHELHGVGSTIITLDVAAAPHFTRFATALNLWPTGDGYMFHTWGRK